MAFEFKAAAKKQVDKEQGQEENILEFSLAGQDFESELPTSGQIALVAGVSSGSQLIASVWLFLSGVLRGDGYRRLRALVALGEVDWDVVYGGNEDNPIGIVEWIIKGASDGRPTQSSTDSTESPTPTGASSTGRVSPRV